MVSFEVTGKRTLVVGGSSGIGYVVAREFAVAGAEVTILAEVEAVHAAATELSRETGRHVGAVRCDITSREAVGEVIASVGTIDVLINNAGIARETPIASREANEAFRLTMDVNVNGLYWVTQAALGQMRDGGRIIFTSSLWGRTAGPGFSAYVASKHAVLGLVKSLAMEVGSRGITVNAVCPGSTATEMNLRELPRDVLDALEAQMQIRPGLLPPEALAGTYLFLASPAASEITGQAIHVDRGQYIGA